jgi:hypothetical protein
VRKGKKKQRARRARMESTSRQSMLLSFGFFKTYDNLSGGEKEEIHSQ